MLCGRNFYQSNGVWDALPWLRGVPVKPEAEEAADADAARVANYNLREHADLSEGATGHHTIAGNRKVHEAIVREVLRVCRRTLESDVEVDPRRHRNMPFVLRSLPLLLIGVTVAAYWLSVVRMARATYRPHRAGGELLPARGGRPGAAAPSGSRR